VLPTQLIPDDNEGKILRVKMIMKEGVPDFEPVYLYDEGSTIDWIPCGRKLTCSYPGIKFHYGPDTYYGHEVNSPLFLYSQIAFLRFCVRSSLHSSMAS
jgi:phosphoribulokinase